MQKFEKNILSVHKEKGREWLDNLPNFLKNIENKLSIKIDKPFENLSFNYVAPVTKNENSWVIKCGIPNQEFNSEIGALKYYAGQGSVHLIDANAEEGWMLLERCIPGKSLQILNHDEKIIAHLIHVLQKVWKPLENNENFPTLKEWFSRLKPYQKIPTKLMDHSKGISKELLDSQGEVVLLHGDLHLQNILSAERESWLAIDPKGIIGEREFDLIGALIHNLNPKELSKKTIANRLAQVSELTNSDSQRLLLWTFSKCVLAACWSIEDGTEETENFIALAEIFHRSFK